MSAEIKTIVCGVDASETAGAAARKAAELARLAGAHLRLVSAYGKFEAETFVSGEERFVYTTEREAQHVAQRVLAALRQAFPGVQMSAEGADGKPGEALVRVAHESKADLIVVGNKRVQGLARVLGSVARDVAAHAPCDVYVAHTHGR
jgi:nucleotide-binding universal stress UspA family protein